MKCILILSALWVVAVLGNFSFGQAGFIENIGDYPSQVSYSHEVSGGRIFFENNRIIYNLQELPGCHEVSTGATSMLHGHAIQLDFLNSNNQSAYQPLNAKSTYCNFYYGGDSSTWKTGVALYESIKIAGIYDDIDLLYYEKGNAIKYDFIVQPTGDPSQIKMSYTGENGIYLDSGKLIIETDLGEIIEQVPYAYQMINGQAHEVECNFIVNGSTVQFELPNGYVQGIELIIDPVLIFSTYSGATGVNSSDATCYDDLGNLYVAGGILMGGYPVTIGAYQTSSSGFGFNIGISKFDGNGNNLLYATYLGGSSDDYPLSMYLGANGEIYVLGVSEGNFPITAGAYDNTYSAPLSDYVIARFNSSGTSLLSSTYLGGSDEEHTPFVSQSQQDVASVYFDGTDVFIVGSSGSMNYPIVGGFQTTKNADRDVVITKLTANLTSVIWSTFLGGSGRDSGNDIKVSSTGDVFVCGTTQSSDFPATALNTSSFGDQDGFVARISADGSTLISSTYIGTSNFDKLKFIQLDSNDDVYLLGSVTNGSYPVTAGAYSSVGSGSNYFVHKISNDLSTSFFSTSIGGSNSSDIYSTAFGIDNCQNIYFTGSSLSGGFPLTTDAYETSVKGLYMCGLETDALSLLYGSYFGGNDVESHYHNSSNCRFNKSGTLFHTECTTSTGYPLFNDYSSCQNSFMNDGAHFKFSFDFNLSLDSLNIGIDTTFNCTTSSYTLDASGYPLVEYLWSTSDTTASINVSSSGTYWVKVFNQCDSIMDTVNIICQIPLPTELVNFEISCFDDNTRNLTWTTASENHNDYFTIERSSNGYEFETLAKIDAVGMSTTNTNYSWNDYSIMHEPAYYRLSQTDINGIMKPLNLIGSNCNENDEIKIYPNPFQDNFLIESKFNGRISLLDIMGTPVMEQYIIAGKNNIKTNSLSPGIYHLIIYSQNGDQQIKKITKM